ncbi:MAG: hypothetical protein ACLQU5_37140 [Isosphaeraceae bacterium]
MPTAAELETRLTCAHIAKECHCHPSAPTRWIMKGASLTDGSRVKLRAVRAPGGWLVRRSDLDQFLEVLTADRLRESTPPEPEPKPTPKAARLRKIKSKLAEAGF